MLWLGPAPNPSIETPKLLIYSSLFLLFNGINIFAKLFNMLLRAFNGTIFSRDPFEFFL
jgi:hypothetical protein